MPLDSNRILCPPAAHFQQKRSFGILLSLTKIHLGHSISKLNCSKFVVVNWRRKCVLHLINVVYSSSFGVSYIVGCGMDVWWRLLNFLSFYCRDGRHVIPVILVLFSLCILKQHTVNAHSGSQSINWSTNWTLCWIRLKWIKAWSDLIVLNQRQIKESSCLGVELRKVWS